MNATTQTAVEQARKKGVRRTATVFGVIAVAIFLLSLWQGFQYS